jgi:hypothetical protein
MSNELLLLAHQFAHAALLAANFSAAARFESHALSSLVCALPNHGMLGIIQSG